MDIFNRNVSTLNGVFTADRAKLTLAGNLGVLVQSMQFNYAQSVTRLYEVGSTNIYYIGGRTMGNLSISRVIGPSGSVCAMYAQYGDVCQARNNTITLTLTENDCSTGSGAASTYLLRNVVITNVSAGVAAQDMIIGENTSAMFSSLECNGGSAVAGGGFTTVGGNNLGTTATPIGG